MLLSQRLKDKSQLIVNKFKLLEAKQNAEVDKESILHTQNLKLKRKRRMKHNSLIQFLSNIRKHKT